MIWLIGNKGMLGYDVERLLKENNLSYLASDREIDITNYQVLENFNESKKIDWIINCAGYTNVDKAKEEVNEVFKINRYGVRNIARLAGQKGIKLIHISTDYVFDGKKEIPLAYKEEDKTEPVNIYGKSKLAGEKEIEKVLSKYFIIRTSWLYGKKGSNFVYTILKLFKEKDMVRVVDDQCGSPTYTADLVEAILKIVKSDSINYGIYHFTNVGVTNWYEFAKIILEKSKRIWLIEGDRKIVITPIKTENYPTAAIRPKNSILSKTKIKKEFNLKIRKWEKALEDFLLSLKNNNRGRIGK